MRIAAYGDLHLSHLPRLDKFRGDEDLLLRWADHLEAGHDRIVLLGDLFQTDYGSSPGSHGDVLQRVIARYPRIATRWRTRIYTSIFGNHDRILQSAWDAAEEIRWNEGDWTMWFIHGHQFDPLVRSKKRSYLVTWGIGGLRRLGLRGLGNFLEESVFSVCQKIARPFGAPDLAAGETLRSKRAQVVVMGHTHQLRWHVEGSGLYANPGGCLAGRLQYVSIDTETKCVEIRRLESSGSMVVLFRWRQNDLTT